MLNEHDAHANCTKLLYLISLVIWLLLRNHIHCNVNFCNDAHWISLMACML